MSKMIFVQDIDTRSSPKVRHEMRDDAVADYASIYKRNKKELPPIVLFTSDNRTYILADGAHRLAAQINNGAKAIIADVHKGTFEEALAYALKANERHGIRRSREDKRQCIAEAIKQWPDITNAQIAERCSVDDKTVKAVRDSMEEAGDIKPEPLRKNAQGRLRPAELNRSEPSQSEKEIPVTPKPAAKVVDAVGRAIPKFCVGFWNRTDEVKELLSHLTHVMTELKKAQHDQDTMFAEVNIGGTLADLNKAWSSIQTAIPYAVCTQCQGHPEAQPNKECRLCKNRGLISKYRWDTAVPADLKQVLLNQAKAT